MGKGLPSFNHDRSICLDLIPRLGHSPVALIICINSKTLQELGVSPRSSMVKLRAITHRYRHLYRQRCKLTGGTIIRSVVVVVEVVVPVQPLHSITSGTAIAPRKTPRHLRSTIIGNDVFLLLPPSLASLPVVPSPSIYYYNNSDMMLCYPTLAWSIVG